MSGPSLVERLRINVPYEAPRCLEAADQIEADAARIAALEARVRELEEEAQNLTDELAYHGIYPNPILQEKNDG